MEITAYLHHIELDKKVVTMCHGDFKQLLKPDNVICQLLLAHMIAVYLVMRPVACRERGQYTATMYSIRMTRWIEIIYKNVEVNYRTYLAWPLLVSDLNKSRTLQQYTLTRH